MAKRNGRVQNVATNKPAKRSAAPATGETATYTHPSAEALLRPDVGTQAQFRKKKEPATYKYDSSLSPVMEWDGQNSGREQSECLVARIEGLTRELAAIIGDGTTEIPADQRRSAAKLRAALAETTDSLKAISKPFLNWAGKAERLSFDVPTLPLFVHERHSTAAIIETLQGHKKDQQMTLFADPQRSIADQVLKAYEHRDKWVNRMILGDSLVVMNSLLHYEGMGGQVQMIYMDPPYGVKFGSNFQPFVRTRDVSHNDDDDMTREPEMVKAYRDTWELGLHSYLTYMRDRLLLARELLARTGSVFVQISDENLHHVRELMDEVFGERNFVGIINVSKTSGLASADSLAVACDYVLWYARDREHVKYRGLFVRREPFGEEAAIYAHLELADGTRMPMTKEQRKGSAPVPEGARRYRLDNLTKPGPGSRYDFEFDGRKYNPGKRWWGTTPDAMSELASQRRLQVAGNTLCFVRFWDDFAYRPVNNLWEDTGTGGFLEEKLYVVQTRQTILERCILMTTDPGDLVLDPTCGSGTTAYTAEKWGRRWIALDVSRVPLALARQRLLTATYPWFELRDESRGPASGFAYKRKQNQKGDEVGGIVPHVTLKSIANNEPPDEEVLVDRPEQVGRITRVCGPFCFEATIPAATDLSAEAAEEHAHSESFVQRMIEILRKSPVLRLEGNKTITLRNVRALAKTLALSAEAMVEGHVPGTPISLADAVQVSKQESGQALPFAGKMVAFVFGPESGAVSEKLVYEAARESYAKSYTHLYVIGFAIQANARRLVQDCEQVVGVPATYVQATPDLLMGDLLKNMRSSQIFSVCGMPEIEVKKASAKKGEPEKWQVKLLGVDVFDPVAMENTGRGGNDVPAWFLDTDYNGLCFHVCQAFFPRTSAWDNLKKALRGTYEESVWDHLAGDTSAPFEVGEQRQVAVKVIDDRGNELMVVKPIDRGGR